MTKKAIDRRQPAYPVNPIGIRGRSPFEAVNGNEEKVTRNSDSIRRIGGEKDEQQKKEEIKSGRTQENKQERR